MIVLVLEVEDDKIGVWSQRGRTVGSKPASHWRGGGRCDIEQVVWSSPPDRLSSTLVASTSADAILRARIAKM